MQGVFNDEDKAKEGIQLTHDTIPEAINLKVIKTFIFEDHNEIQSVLFTIDSAASPRRHWLLVG